VFVRPIRPQDREVLTKAFARLGEQSRYQRFFSPINELSESELRYFTEVDHHDHEALVAFDAETGDGVGVARFVRLDDGTSAEAAVTVIDEWQGRGVGTALVAAVERLAAAREYRTLFAVSNNDAFFRSRGYAPAAIPELSRERSEVTRFKGVYAKDLDRR
jgi:N-acetylglutamate synthase-like GNAT family acetyltransferase